MDTPSDPERFSNPLCFQNARFLGFLAGCGCRLLVHLPNLAVSARPGPYRLWGLKNRIEYHRLWSSFRGDTGKLKTDFRDRL